MAKIDVAGLLDQFQDGDGFGDPEARRNAEMRANLQMAGQQLKEARRLNTLSLLLVFVGLLQVAIQAVQAWTK